MRPVLEGKSDGGRPIVRLLRLHCGASSHLEEVKGWDVQAVARWDALLIKVIDAVRCGELIEVRLEQVDRRFIDVQFDNHLVTLFRVHVGGSLPWHHLWPVHVRYQCNFKTAIDGTEYLISPLVVGKVAERLANSELKALERGHRVVELWVHYVLLNRLDYRLRGLSKRHAQRFLRHRGQEVGCEGLDYRCLRFKGKT